MSARPAPRDLVALVADKSLDVCLRALLSRTRSLEIRAIDFDIFRHPRFDSGCYAEGPDFLRLYCDRYSHAILLFDRHGSGRREMTREQIEEMLETRLAACGWGRRAAAVVIDPELEAWVWSDSPHVDRDLGWAGRKPRLRDWLVAQGFLSPGKYKPDCPQQAMLAALEVVGQPKSSSIFGALAKSVSLTRCTDPTFLKLVEKLREWFTASAG